MGVYAQTEVEIELNTKKAFEKVLKIVKSMKPDRDGNTWLENVETDVVEGSDIWYIYGFMASGRIQNLEWRCEQIWEKIKDIDGVVSFNCPFMAEAEGVYHEAGEGTKLQVKE